MRAATGDEHHLGCHCGDLSVVDRLVRTVAGRPIPPAQTVSNDKDDLANHSPIIYPRNPVRQRKIGLDPAHLRLGE